MSNRFFKTAGLLASHALALALAAGAQTAINPNQIYRGRAITTPSSALAVSFCGTTFACEWHINGPATFSGNTSLPANIGLFFEGGGQLAIAAGATVTILGNVSAPLGGTLFTGAGSVSFGVATTEAKVEWFGARGDGATDDTAAFQSAIAACAVAKCDVSILLKTYIISSPLVLLANGGITGPPAHDDSTATAALARILSTSATADVVELGPQGNTTFGPYTGQRLINVALGRTVLPAAGSRGLACYLSVGFQLKHVVSSDSSSDFWFNGCSSGNYLDGIQNVVVRWGDNGVSGYVAGTILAGIDLDSENGQAENTIVLNGIGCPAQPAGTIAKCISVHGSAVNDVNFYNVDCNSLAYGLEVISTAGDKFDGSFDLHFSNLTLDRCGVSCVHVKGISTAGDVVLNDLYAVANSSSPSMVVENTSGLHMIGGEIGNTGGGGGLKLTNSLDGLYTSMVFDYAEGTQLELNNSQSNVFDGIKFLAETGVNYMVALENYSFKNFFSNLRGDGSALGGMYFDATSGLNFVGMVDFIGTTPTTIVHPYTDFSLPKQLSPSCPVAGIPVVRTGGTAGSGATAVLLSSPSIPGNTCNFTVVFTPGAGATAGAVFYAAVAAQVITSSDTYGNPTGVTQETTNMPGGFSCLVTPYGNTSAQAMASASTLPSVQTDLTGTTVSLSVIPTQTTMYTITCAR